MTVAILSPLPPAKSGIADYMFELLPEFAVRAPVVVFHNQEKIQPLPADIETKPMSEFPAFIAQNATAQIIYQLGNNPDHEFVYRTALRHPGICVLHDGSLHHLIESITLGMGKPHEYEAIHHMEYGEAGAAIAELRQAGIYSAHQHFLLPLTRHVLDRQKAVIANSDYLTRRIQAQTRTPVFGLKHHVSPKAFLARNESKEETRSRCKLPAGKLIISSLGYITKPKMISSVLKALRLMANQGHDFFYVIGGEKNPGYDVDKDIRELDLESRVKVTGFLTEQEFYDYLRLSDVLVNLRYPSVGESSGSLSRALGIGIPTIVYNFGPMSEYPDDVVVKVPLELAQEPVALADAIIALKESVTLRKHIAAAAVGYANDVLTTSHVVESYFRVLDAVAHQ